MTSLFVRLAALLLGLAMLPAFAADTAAEQKVLGNHPLTLQWLGFGEGPTGTAKIYRKGEDILVDGEQRYRGREDSGYLTLKGKLRILNERELEFEGTIVTQSTSINGGKPYTREGKYLLKAWGKRQYWRMQNMTQPDGESTVTDYIDIFFAKR